MNTYIWQQVKRQLSFISIGILIFSIVGCQDRTKETIYSVRKVSDGDTIAVKDASDNNFTVRFACVDAPEIPHSNAEKQSKKAIDKDQFKWGLKALARLQQLIQQGGSRVNLTITDSDRYGRKVSEVRLPDGTLAQQVLAKEGLVMVYTPYLKNCPSAAIIEQAEAEAKKKKLGVWGDSKFVAPWEYRKQSK